jgi:hypothetical protein
MTKTEQIVAAIVAILQAAGLNVRADTANQESFEDMPAIVVVIGDDTPRPDTFGGGYVKWDLSVTLIIVAEGGAPLLAPEPTRAAAHAALYADRTLSGLAVDLTVGPVTRSIDEANPALGVAQAVYNILYRQLEGQV